MRRSRCRTVSMTIAQQLCNHTNCATVCCPPVCRCGVCSVEFAALLALAQLGPEGDAMNICRASQSEPEPQELSSCASDLKSWARCCRRRVCGVQCGAGAGAAWTGGRRDKGDAGHRPAGAWLGGHARGAGGPVLEPGECQDIGKDRLKPHSCAAREGGGACKTDTATAHLLPISSTLSSTL